MALTRDQILGADDIAKTEVQVPEWGGSVWIRQLTRGEQDAYLKKQMGDARVKTERKGAAGEIAAASMFGHDAWLCATAIVGEDGKSMFSEKDIEALKKKNGAVIGRLALEIVTFSGMADDASVEQEAKN